MSLRTRLRRLEGSAEQPECDEHWAPANLSLPIDYRKLLAPFSPDPAERAQYERDWEAQRCAKCGWTPIHIVATAEWPNQGRGGLDEPTTTAG